MKGHSPADAAPPARTGFTASAGRTRAADLTDRAERTHEYTTRSGIRIRRATRPLPADPDPLAALAARLDSSRGVLLASDFEQPGRHRRWAVGFADPPLVLTARGRDLRIEALNDRGRVLLTGLAPQLRCLDAVQKWQCSDMCLDLTVRPADESFTEEERSRQPSVFSVLRLLTGLLAAPDDQHLGLYGAFGYDLVFQIDQIDRLRPRDPDQRDLVLYLPDELLLVDAAGHAVLNSYDFHFPAGPENAETGELSTAGLPRSPVLAPYRRSPDAPATRDHAPGEYAEAVGVAREAFRRGDLFEVVLSQTFSRPCPAPPSELLRRLRGRNSAPYAALLNLGAGEYLVSSSPAMYVRVTRRPDGDWTESCPISGTVARGGDALRDADAILALLSSAKDNSELTMCTDVDRNDKSRICEPDTVQVIGRRQIEAYADVVHTVDHIVGRLRSDRDAIDAFLAHMWAVTVTGAPKLWAMRFIERHERTPRRWYAGAVGFLGFDGGMSTGIALRTLQIRDGVAHARAGATLLFDSDPAAEERESELKVNLFLDVLDQARGDSAPGRADRAPAAPTTAPRAKSALPRTGRDRRILLIDHEDSFVHTLAGYFRLTGAHVATVRAPLPPDRLAEQFDRLRPDLLVLSPGPGVPDDFAMRRTLEAAFAREVPVFGVCLGLQGVVEYFGGDLELMPRPMHGKTVEVRIQQPAVRAGGIFSGLPPRFEVGLYHSLHATRAAMPPELRVTAEAAGIVMAVEHEHYPLAATQFHPESVMTSRDATGRRLIENVVRYLPERG